MKSFLIAKNDSGQRLDKFITKSVPNLPQSLMYKYIRMKRIKVNGKRGEISQKLAEGDTVVMVSDGITQGKEECPWLFDLLRSQGEDASVERIADLVVKYAKGEGASDDLSVLVMRIAKGKH